MACRPLMTISECLGMIVLFDNVCASIEVLFCDAGLFVAMLDFCVRILVWECASVSIYSRTLVLHEGLQLHEAIDLMIWARLF